MKRDNHAPPIAKSNGAPPAEGLQRIRDAEAALVAAEKRVIDLRKRLHDAAAEADKARQALRVTIREECDPHPTLFDAAKPN